MLEKNNIHMIEEIKVVIINNRNKIAYEVNNIMLLAYWMLIEILKLNMANGFKGDFILNIQNSRHCLLN